MDLTLYETVMVMVDGKRKQQSAMEYLMTYGWSILIIAIVLAALFSLGVFSNSNLGPRAQPNSCRVYRPNGPGTTTNINLEGTCNGELPEYVAEFNSNNVANVLIRSSSFLSASNTITISLWMYPSAPFPLTSGTFCTHPLTKGSYNNNDANYVFYFDHNSCDPNGPWIEVAAFSSGDAWNLYSNQDPISQTQWYNIIWAYNSVTGGCFYVNGVSDGCAGTGSLMTNNEPLLIDDGSFTGLIANVQIYSSQLDANAVQALYLEGIGGAPVEPQYISGWWPLNGDANDYSGNGGNGVPTNVIFTESWTNGYTAP